MRALQDLESVQDTLSTLTLEHKKIMLELQAIENCVPEHKTNFSPDAIKLLKNLNNLLVVDHHRREDAVLFEWMIAQNPDADRKIIDRIQNDHREFEKLLQSILKQTEELKFSHALAYDVLNFVDSYREHVDLEEKFIYQIAKGLLNSQRK